MIAAIIVSQIAMLSKWESVLHASGAVVASGSVADFGDAAGERAAAATDDVLADLSQLSLIRASGAERVPFLQGQFSNDLRELNGTTQLHAYCNAQGRMLAVLRAFARGDDIYLQLPASLLEATLKRLRMFVLRAQVKLESADDALARVGVSGANAAALLADVGLTAPQSMNACVSDGDITVMRIPGMHPRFQLVAEPASLEPIWNRLRTAAKPVGASVWSWLDIVAGLPQVFPQTVEAFVPQMANLDRIGGISFKKGCYPGQEIVARMHYLGKLKQRMYRAHLAVGEPAPQPGDALYAPDFGTQQAGTIVDAQAAPQGGFDLLAVIHISSYEVGTVHWRAVDGARLTFAPLPYGLDIAS